MSQEKTSFLQRFKSFRHRSSEKEASTSSGQARNSSLDMDETIANEGRRALTGWPFKMSDIAKHVPEGSAAARGLTLGRELISVLADESSLISTARSAISTAPTQDDARVIFGMMVTARDGFNQQSQSFDDMVRTKSAAEMSNAAEIVSTKVKDMLEIVLKLVQQARPYLRNQQEKIDRLEKEIEALAGADTERVAYSNPGSGFQAVQSGRGTQNNNNGNGFFSNGRVSGGSFHWGVPQPAEPRAAS